MSSVELATAYVNIVPSAAGITDKLRGLFGDLPAEGAKAGDESATSFFDKFKGRGKELAGAAGVALSAALVKGFSDSAEFEASNDKLAAQLGLPPELAKEMGDTAGNLYAGAYGESVGQVNEALAQVWRNGLLPEDAGQAELEALTAKVLDVSTAMDQDLGATTRGVSNLIRNGLAKDADEALDIITRGFQQGADKSEDFLDTLNEYGTQFRKLGIDGETSTGLIIQGLQAGARDGDKVADALKEFSIRAIDGSKLTAESFQALGFSAEETAWLVGEIALGGDNASAALDQTLDRLRGMEDPVARSAAAVGLFGTQAEDLGDALYALDPSSATAALGKVEGAATTLGDTLNNNSATKIEAWKRKVQLALADVGGAVGPVLAVAPGVAGMLTSLNLAGPAFSKVGSAAKSMATGLVSTVKAAAASTVAAAKSAASWVASTASMVAHKVASVATAAATKAMAAAQWLLNAAMSANPIGLIVIALTALVAGLVLAYNKSETFRAIVDAIGRAIMTGLKAAVDWIVNTAWPAVLGFFQAIGDAIGTAVGAVVGFGSSVIDALAGAASWLIETGQAIVSGLLDGIMAYLELVKAVWIDFPLSVLNWIGDTARTLWDKGTALVGGILGGIVAKAVELATWWGGLQLKVLGWIGDAGAWLIGKGKDLITGMVNGLESAVSSTLSAALNLHERIRNMVGDLGSTLWNAGTKVIQGLIDGINSKVQAVKDTLGRVTDLIPDWKGPASKDAKLLFGAGQLVLQGFMDGIDAQRSALKRQLGAISAEVAATDMGALGPSAVRTPSYGVAAPASVGVAGSGGTNVYVTNPMPRPRDVGDAVAWANRTSGRAS